MTPRRRFVLAIVLGPMLLASAALTQARQLAIVVRDDPSLNRTAIEAGFPGGWPRLDPGFVFRAGGFQVLITPPLSDPLAAALFATARSLVATEPSVLAAGELLRVRGGEVTINSGYLLLRGDLPAIELWGAGRGYTVARKDLLGRYVVLDVSLSNVDLITQLASLPPSVASADPIAYHLLPNPSVTDFGGFHRIPAGRNVLGLILHPGVGATAHQPIITASGASGVIFEHTPSEETVHFVTFADEANMMIALHALLDPANATTVMWAGPALSRDPPQFLSAGLIVDFVDGRRMDAAAPVLARFGLVLERELPYLDYGFLFRREVNGRPEPSYELYDAASALLGEGYANIAVPDVIARNRSQDCVDCKTHDTQHYFEEVNAVGGWSAAAEEEPITVIGLLDEGFTGSDSTSTWCKKLNVVAVQNSLACEAAWNCPTSQSPQCFPDDFDSWCATCGAPPRDDGDTLIDAFEMQDAAHATGMALVAASRHDVTPTGRSCGAATPTTACEEYLGMADGSPLINVAQNSDSLSTRVADALWWMSGGDPNDSDYYPNQLGDRAATVLNLSFARNHKALKHCTEDATWLCAKVCGEDVACDMLDIAMGKLRNGEGDGIREQGILIVNAMEYYGLSNNDIDESENTVAVGTVEYDSGKPFDSADKRFVWPTEYIDLVVPMGGDGNTLGFSGAINAGDTSAAAAAVSGVAARMFDVYPEMTAKQAHCLLKETANQHATGMWNPLDLAMWSGTLSIDCTFGYMKRGGVVYAVISNGNFSECFGHGMLDAGAAIEAARNCVPCSIRGLAVDMTTGEVSEVELPCWFWADRFSDTFDFPSSACLCDSDGNLNDPGFTINMSTGTVCMNCGVTDPFANQKSLEKVTVLLHCIREGDCVCSPVDPECVQLDVVNRRDIDLHDVRVEFWRGRRCGDPVALEKVWLAGEKIGIPLPQDECFLDCWTGNPDSEPEVRVFAGKKRIEID